MSPSPTQTTWRTYYALVALTVTCRFNGMDGLQGSTLRRFLGERDEPSASSQLTYRPLDDGSHNELAASAATLQPTGA